MLKMQEIAATFKKYDGRHLFVRVKHLDASPHLGRAKVISIHGNKVEVQPLGGHQRLEYLPPEELTWWNSEIRKYHPDFKATTGDYPPGTHFIVIDDHAQKFRGKSEWVTSLEDAVRHVRITTARNSVGRLRKKLPGVRLVSYPEAEHYARQWAAPRDEQEAVLTPAAPPHPDPLRNVEVLRLLGDVEVAWEFMDQTVRRLLAGAKEHLLKQ
jgi:hypothetical protein